MSVSRIATGSKLMIQSVLRSALGKMASIPREIIQKHNKLLVDLCDYIDPKDPGYTNFITSLRNADLPPGRLSRVENEPAKLFQLMEQKGKLKVGDYGVLEEALQNSGNDEALSLVRRLGSEITKEMAGQGLTTSSAAEETVQERDISPNKRVITVAETTQELDGSPSKRKKPEPRDASDIPKKRYYDRENKRGYLLILNFTKDREGTELDVSNLKKFFEGTLNFDVDDPREDRHNDFSLSELNKVLEQTRELLNFRAKKFYCFFCAILSHGDEKGILCDDGLYKTIDEIRTTFANDKMRNFVGKPRVFLIQACRGTTTQQGHDMADDWPTDIADVAGKISVPTDADVLMAYATTPGNKAWRRENIGSWFIHVTISVLEERHLHEHVEEMFVTVKDEIAKDEKWKTASGGRMMPCTWSTLTQRLMI